MKIDVSKKDQLQAPLPSWAVKKHPTKTYLSVIHPMAVIDRLDKVFGRGQWIFRTREIDCTKEQQKTKNDTREVWMSAVHGTLEVPEYDIHIEQFGGSTNDDKGDALKGGATDALTKCASYLGVGASIYKGMGNSGADEPPEQLEDDEFNF